MAITPEPVFPHEHLDVYEMALMFVTHAHDVVARLPRGHASMADQLERAAASIALNTAEGSAEFRPKEKARFYRMALRSSAECAAAMDVAHRLHAVDEARFTECKALLGRIAAMLRALVRRHAKA